MPLEKQYERITSEKWKRIVSAAAIYGIEINGHTGEGHAFGVVLRWAWGPGSRRLAITIIKSTLLPEDKALQFVEGIIEDA